MRIGKNEYSQIIITDKDKNLVASITDKDVISEKEYAVDFLPIDENGEAS